MRLGCSAGEFRGLQSNCIITYHLHNIKIVVFLSRIRPLWRVFVLLVEEPRWFQSYEKICRNLIHEYKPNQRSLWVHMGAYICRLGTRQVSTYSTDWYKYIFQNSRITCQLSLFSNATTDISLHALVSPHHPWPAESPPRRCLESKGARKMACAT